MEHEELKEVTLKVKVLLTDWMDQECADGDQIEDAIELLKDVN